MISPPNPAELGSLAVTPAQLASPLSGVPGSPSALDAVTRPLLGSARALLEREKVRLVALLLGSIFPGRLCSAQNLPAFQAAQAQANAVHKQLAHTLQGWLAILDPEKSLPPLTKFAATPARFFFCAVSVLPGYRALLSMTCSQLLDICALPDLRTDVVSIAWKAFVRLIVALSGQHFLPSAQSNGLGLPTPSVCRLNPPRRVRWRNGDDSLRAVRRPSSIELSG